MNLFVTNISHAVKEEALKAAVLGNSDKCLQLRSSATNTQESQKDSAL